MPSETKTGDINRNSAPDPPEPKNNRAVGTAAEKKQTSLLGCRAPPVLQFPGLRGPAWSGPLTLETGACSVQPQHPDQSEKTPGPRWEPGTLGCGDQLGLHHRLDPPLNGRGRLWRNAGSDESDAGDSTGHPHSRAPSHPDSKAPDHRPSSSRATRLCGRCNAVSSRRPGLGRASATRVASSYDGQSSPPHDQYGACPPHRDTTPSDM